MPRLSTRVDLHSEDYRDNERAMRALVDGLHGEVARVARGGSRAATDKHRAASKLSARERIRVLLDTGSPFLEFSQLAAHGMYGGDIACAGIITGIGRIAGRECVVVCNDPTVKGGTYYPITVKKHLRAQEIARDLAVQSIDQRAHGALVVAVFLGMQVDPGAETGHERLAMVAGLSDNHTITFAGKASP